MSGAGVYRTKAWFMSDAARRLPPGSEVTLNEAEAALALSQGTVEAPKDPDALPTLAEFRSFMSGHIDAEYARMVAEHSRRESFRAQLEAHESERKILVKDSADSAPDVTQAPEAKASEPPATADVVPPAAESKPSEDDDDAEAARKAAAKRVRIADRKG